MFLIPAIFAFVSDGLVIYLYRWKEHGFDEEEDLLVYHVAYLVVLAAIRMVLIFAPLLFHSYTGTALKVPQLYQVLYVGTAVVLVGHMVGLMLMNPQSLESMFLSSSFFNKLQNFHELRRIWWMILLSTFSDACHVILFRHVRSTASPFASFSKTPSVYFALRSSSGMGRSLDPLDPNSASTPDGDYLVRSMNQFVDKMQLKLHQARQEWISRLDDFTNRIAGGGNTINERVVHNPLAPLTPFRILLQLFAYEDVIQSGKLDAVFQIDDGASMTFFVPQLVSFLLHGAFYQSPQLEEWILDKCRKNVHFAHRCYWFLRSWCLEVPVEAVTTPSLSRNNSQNNLNGLQPFLDQPVAPESSVDCRPVIKSPSAKTIFRKKGSDKFLPGERQMIERLMMRVKECGEIPAKRLAFGSPSVEDEASPMRNALIGTVRVHDESPSSLVAAAETGAVPIHPMTGYPSMKHAECLSATHRYGFELYSHALEERQNVATQRHGETDQFDKTPQFLDALIYLAESLFSVPKDQRQEKLRRQLQMLECDLLPCNAVYLPIGNVHHRVWRIVADESIAINTKERVPCIVCLEVINYTHGRRNNRGWSLLDSINISSRWVNDDTMIELRQTGLPQMPDPAEIIRNNSTLSMDSVTGSRHSLWPDRNGDRSETEIVDHWRNAPRNPLRRIPLIDKVATTVNNTVKAPLNRVKHQMRDRISQFRDRTLSEEQRRLNESVDSEFNEDNHVTDYQLDVESGDVLDSSTGPVTPKSERSARGHGQDLGQWSSSPPQRRRVMSAHGYDNGFTSTLRRRLDNDSDVGLRYGSDQEEDTQATTPSKQKNPTHIEGEDGIDEEEEKNSTKSPQVVFRESWESKQERIRKQSAWGHHPGWRLLPVLLKANDDLRQEQLAAQLIFRMASILAREKVPVWLYPYEILALTDTAGIIEAIPDTISLDSLKKNSTGFTTLRAFFNDHFGRDTDQFADARSNFIESLAAYSMVCFLLQIKDRHNGNILLDNRGHVIHIDFGFFFLSSPGKNAGFESAPFKLTNEFVEVMEGPHSHCFKVFRDLCIKTFLGLRKHCMEIILLVEMLKTGNEELKCFRGRPDDAIQQLRDRFRLDLSDRACQEYVNALIDNSVENWRTDWYDRYQRYFVGVL